MRLQNLLFDIQLLPGHIFRTSGPQVPTDKIILKTESAWAQTDHRRLVDCGFCLIMLALAYIIMLVIDRHAD